MIAEKFPYTLLVEQDDFPFDPRKDSEPLGTMTCFHHDYSLGDEHSFKDTDDFFFSLLEEIHGAEKAETIWKETTNRILENRPVGKSLNREFDNAILKIIEQDYIIMPLYLLDHSGLSISVEDFGDYWDSGQVGLTYVSHEKVLKEFDSTVLSEDLKQKAKAILTSETQEYDHYLKGECYGFELFENGTEIESCWGFLGDYDDVLKSMEDYFPKEAKGLTDKLQEDKSPLVTSVLRASPETQSSLRELLAQMKDTISQEKRAEEKTSTRDCER